MSKLSKNKTHVFLALFLSVVFFSTFLVKPVHILFFHHDLTERAAIQIDQTTISNPSNTNCPICDFEFCLFIADKPISIEKIPEIFARQKTPQTIDCLASQVSQHFQLRAPPVI